MPATQTPIRLGIVGVGKIVRDQHLPAVARDGAFCLTAAASRHGRVDGIPNFASLEAMLDEVADIDAVSLCMPPQFRYDAARTAIEAGKHSGVATVAHSAIDGFDRDDDHVDGGAQGPGQGSGGERQNGISGCHGHLQFSDAKPEPYALIQVSGTLYHHVRVRCRHRLYAPAVLISETNVFNLTNQE